MNPLGELGQRIRDEFPDAELQVEAPAQPDGAWFLTVKFDEPALVVQWRPSEGFGVSRLPSHGLGDAFDEHYDDLEQVAERALSLLREAKRPEPSGFVGL